MLGFLIGDSARLLRAAFERRKQLLRGALGTINANLQTCDPLSRIPATSDEGL